MNRHRGHFTSLVFITLSGFLLRTFCQSILGILISFIPVLHGCESLHQDGSFTGHANHIGPVKLAVHDKDKGTDMLTLEVLVFNDDPLHRLDCYHRFEKPDSGNVDISSQNGQKIIMACANSNFRREDWMQVTSLSSLTEMKADLENEVRESPVLSGSIKINAGEEGHSLSLERLHSAVILRTISCDFTGRAYEGENIRNARVYLTNVNATCPIWGSCGYAERYVNRGGISEDDISRFTDRSLIIDTLGTIGSETMQCGTALICYPNHPESEGPGTSFTRLVIEGEVGGETWFWPIEVNMDAGSEHRGIGRNMTYIYDIVITRKGSADPDTAIETGNIGIRMEVREWKRKEEYEEVF